MKQCLCRGKMLDEVVGVTKVCWMNNKGFIYIYIFFFSAEKMGEGVVDLSF